MKLKYILPGLFALLSLSSCSVSPDDFRLEEWHKVEVKGTTLTQSRINLNASITNNSKTKVALKDADLYLHTAEGKNILEITIEEPVTLPKRKTTDVSLPVIIRYKSGLGAISGLARLNGDTSDLRVSGAARLKGGCIKKKFELNDVPFDKFMHMLGVDPKDLKLLF